jgi:hypothetical protein
VVRLKSAMVQIRWRQMVKLLLVAIAAVLMVMVPIQQARSNCDPSYPTVCIAPPPPDLDCADIPYQNFPVRPPDPHRFDGGRNHTPNGIGCETPR